MIRLGFCIPWILCPLDDAPLTEGPITLGQTDLLQGSVKSD